MDLVAREVRDHMIVGRLVTEKVLNKHTVKSMIIKAWNMHSGLEILKVRGNTFSFSFEREEDYARIMKGRPWIILLALANSGKVGTISYIR